MTRYAMRTKSKLLVGAVATLVVVCAAFAVRDALSPEPEAKRTEKRPERAQRHEHAHASSDDSSLRATITAMAATLRSQEERLNALEKPSEEPEADAEELDLNTADL